MKELTRAYREAGVDTEAAGSFVERIKRVVKRTHVKGVVSEIGLFGGMFKLDTSVYSSPILVASADGVGTKLKLAFLMDKHDTVGIDLVAMNVNDIVVHGARPLFFLDYLAMEHLEVDRAEEIIRGIARGCEIAGCALLGGETAELPGFYNKGEYELSGFCVGVADNSRIIDGSCIGMGNVIIGIGSSGVHSNGFSLVRKILNEKDIALDTYVEELGRTLGEELLIPTRIYVSSILNIVRDFEIKGMAHITGGGFYENISRILPRGVKAKIDFYSWDKPPVFHWIKENANLSWEEMMAIFNCGVGIVVIVGKDDVEEIMGRLHGLKERSWVIGEVLKQDGSEKVEVYF